MEKVRNRFKNLKEKTCEEKKETPELLNECSWDAVAVAKRKMQILPPSDTKPKTLDKKQLADVRKVYLQSYN